MGGKVIIRDYTSGDYSQILDLWEKVGLGSAHRVDNQKIIEHSIEIGGKLLVATLEGGRIVGTSWMTFDGRRIHLHHFGVDPNYQGKGIGDTLTLESLRFAKQKGYQIKLEVHCTNKAAIALYKKHGFSYLGDYDVYIVRNIVGLKI